MSIQKPEPLVVGGKAFYTLTSYGPVKTEVTEPLTTDAEVDFATDAVLRQAGATEENLADPAWMRDHLHGVSDLSELKRQIRAELETMNEVTVSRQVEAQCLDQLAERLCQSVPRSEVEKFEDVIAQQIAMSITGSAPGITLAQALAGMGIDPDQFDQMVAEQARLEAEHAAALDAYASEKGIKVEETELPHLLELSPADADSLIRQAKEAGQMDDLMEAARRSKALRSVLDECECVRRRETPEEAQRRLDQIAAEVAAQEGLADGSLADGGDEAGETFRLV